MPPDPPSLLWPSATVKVQQCLLSPKRLVTPLYVGRYSKPPVPSGEPPKRGIKRLFSNTIDAQVRPAHAENRHTIGIDFNRIVGSIYQNILYYLKSCGVLDPLSDVHLFCLHLVYISRINESLEEFTHQHNYPLRTVCNRSPLQLFCRPIFQSAQSDVLPFKMPSYGIDEGPSPQVDDEDAVIVAPIRVSLTEPQLQSLHQLIVNTRESDDFGVSSYMRLRSTVNNWM